MKSLFRHCFARVACLVLASVSIGCATADRSLYPASSVADTVDVIVLDNHWHTSLIVPFAELPADLRRELKPFEADRYVVLGWGDADFYRAEAVTSGMVPQAMFYSRGSVMSVIGFSAEPEDFFGDDVYRIPVSREGRSRLISHIDRTFVRKDGRLQPAGNGPLDSRFYWANGRYGWNHTCNHWTAAALKSAGLPITPLYASTALNFAFQIRQLPSVRFNGRQLPVPKPLLSPPPHRRFDRS